MSSAAWSCTDSTAFLQLQRFHSSVSTATAFPQLQRFHSYSVSTATAFPQLQSFYSQSVSTATVFPQLQCFYRQSVSTATEFPQLQCFYRHSVSTASAFPQVQCFYSQSVSTATVFPQAECFHSYSVPSSWPASLELAWVSSAAWRAAAGEPARRARRRAKCWSTASRIPMRPAAPRPRSPHSEKRLGWATRTVCHGNGSRRREFAALAAPHPLDAAAPSPRRG